MKKVWILEKLYTPEETKKSLAETQTILDTAGSNPSATEEAIKAFQNIITSLEQKLVDFPEGYWGGFEGKVIYSQFCQVAKAAIRRNPDCIFRVVSAEIEDNAWSWMGYKNPQVNEGVLRYLKATC